MVNLNLPCFPRPPDAQGRDLLRSGAEPALPRYACRHRCKIVSCSLCYRPCAEQKSGPDPKCPSAPSAALALLYEAWLLELHLMHNIQDTRRRYALTRGHCLRGPTRSLIIGKVFAAAGQFRVCSQRTSASVRDIIAATVCSRQ